MGNNRKGKIEYIDFPEELKGSYQSYTEANISKLRKKNILIHNLNYTI